MDIVKQLNGSVKFIRSGVVVQTLLENVTARLNEKRNGLFFVDTRGLSIEIFTNQVENTQLLPAAPIKFQPGTTVELWDVLLDPTASPFFVDLRLKFAAGGFDPNAIHDNVANEINSIAQKLVPVGADELLIEDSAAGYIKKKVLISTLPTGILNGVVCFDGEITPPLITVNQNDYAPAGINTANFVRLSTNGNRQITGIIKPSPLCNQVLHLLNIGVNNVLIRENNAGSLADNRFLLGANKTIQPNEGLFLIYDQTSLKWRSSGANL